MGDKTQTRKRTEPIRAHDENNLSTTLSSTQKSARDSENLHSFRAYHASPITPGTVLSSIENSCAKTRSEYVKDFPLKITKGQRKKPGVDNSEEIQKLRKVIAEEQSTAKKYKNELVSIKDKLSVQVRLNEKQNNEIEQLSRAVCSYESDINSLLKTKNCLVNDIQDLQNQIMQLRSTHENDVKRLQAHISLISEKPEVPDTAVIPELERAKEQISTLQNEYENAFSAVRKELAAQKQANSVLARCSATSTRPQSEKKVVARQRPSSSKRGRSFLAEPSRTQEQSKKPRKVRPSVRKSSSVRRVTKSKPFRR